MIDAKNLETLLEPILIKFRTRLRRTLPAFTAFQHVLLSKSNIPLNAYDAMKTRVHKIAGSAKILGFETLGASAAEVEACIFAMGISETGQVSSKKLITAFDKFLLNAMRAASSGGTGSEQNKSELPSVQPQNPKYNVLIIDDDEFTRDLVKLSLTGEDCSFFEAETGMVGLKYLNFHTPDLVVLDVNLPDINGFDVLKKIMISGYEKFPVVMLTREDGVDSRVTGIAAGAMDYVTKPVSLGKLNKFLGDNIKYNKFRYEDEMAHSRHEQIMKTMKRSEFW